VGAVTSDDQDFPYEGVAGRTRLEPLHVTVPGGTYGARGSRLMQLLKKRHGEVALSPEELTRIALWIDCNSVFYGAYDPAEQARQLRGEIIGLPEVQ